MSSNFYQLFKKKPDETFIFKIMKLYGFKNIDENHKFNLYDLEKWHTVDELNKLKYELSEYYITCKFKQYVENLNTKKCITILRHFIRPINYILISHEKYYKGNKFLVYHIENIKIPSPDDFKFTIEFN